MRHFEPLVINVVFYFAAFPCLGTASINCTFVRSDPCGYSLVSTSSNLGITFNSKEQSGRWLL